MDIYRWVTEAEVDLLFHGERGRRLARILAELPSAVVSDEHATADALYDEGMEIARGLSQPWVEVYLRHWNLQSRVFHRGEGRVALRDALGLVEIAARDTSRGCPQAICAVQDLGACYGHVDGPGFANERRAVSETALARIDATWPCFACLCGEYAEALLDEGKPLDALRWLESQADRKGEAEGPPARERFLYLVRARALLEAGHPVEALVMLQVADPDEDLNDEVARRLLRCRVLVALGREAEAQRALPAVDVVDGTPAFFHAWWATVRALVEQGRWPNDAALGALIGRWVTHLERRGVVRRALELAHDHGRFAVARGSLTVARRALETMRRLASNLRRPLDAEALIRDLHERIEGSAPRPVELPDDPDALLRRFWTDPEARLRRLEAALARWPGDARVVEAHAAALLALGWPDAAEHALDDFLAVHPDDPVALNAKAELSLQVGDGSGVRRAAQRLVDTGRPHVAAWVLARWHAEEGDLDDAIDELDRLTADDPHADDARRLRAAVARARGDHAAVLAAIDGVQSPNEGDLWQVITSASVLRRWDQVRALARALGIDVPDGAGMPFVDLGGLRLRLHSGQEVLAQRTGPATALIAEVTAPGQPQRFGEVVVYDARSAREGAWDEVAVVLAGGFSGYSVEGLHPGPEDVDALRDTVVALGGEAQEAGELLRVYEPGSVRAHEGLRLWLAIPDGVDLAALHQRVRRWAAGRPLWWPDLARDAGQDADARALEQLRSDWTA